MSLFYFLTLLAAGLTATALFAGLMTIVSHALGQHLDAKRKSQRAKLFQNIVQGLEKPEWDADLVNAMRRRRRIAADLFSEISELIRGENLEKVLSLCRQAGVDRWLLKQMQSRWRERRRMAADALRLFPGEDTVEVLHAALNDRSGAVRLRAALSLAELDALPSVSVFVQKLIERERQQSLLMEPLFDSLAVSRPAEVLEVAKGALGQAFLRPVAVRSLGKSRHLGSTNAIAKLIEDSDPEVRAAALDATMVLGNFSASEHIRQALADSIQFVRVRAIDAARRLELRQLVPELRLLLQDSNWWVRFRASEALVALGERVPERGRVTNFAPDIQQQKPHQRGAA